MRKFSVLVVALSALSLQACVPAVATGVGAGVLMVEDRRTSGIYVEDQSIELKAANRIDERFQDKVHINVTSYNRIVLITGEAPNEEIKNEIGTIAKSQANVRNVINDVALAEPTSFSSRSNDSYITSKVKARFVDAGKFQANHVKVVTENSVVYLLGLVKHKEADDAVEIASTTGGVSKVVKMFEYLD
jgi:osmotically-inducible protein OsmY